MKHPFLSLDPKLRARIFRWTLAATILNSIILQYFGGNLVNDVAPAGIVSYEFVTSPDHAQQVIESWADVRQHAFLVLLFDMPYLVLYSTNIALASLWVRDVAIARGAPLGSLGVPIAWSLWVAGVLDAVENTASFIMLTQDTPAAPWPDVSYYCAAVKFAFVGIGLLYAIYGAAIRLSLKPKT